MKFSKRAIGECTHVRVIRPGRGLLLAMLAAALVSLTACKANIPGQASYVSIRAAGDVLTPTAIAAEQRFTRVTAGLHNACSVTADARGFCWGSNEYQQLGSSAAMGLCDAGATRCSATPLAVDGGLAFVEIAASLRASCGLTANGAAWCWGFGQGGQLGNGQGTDSAMPVEVAGAAPFSQIALGGTGLIACAVTAAGRGYCWGPGGRYGGLGDGDTNGSNTPVAVAGGLDLASISVGDDHACGLTTAGAAYCLGSNAFGKLGSGPNATVSSVPVPVAGGLTFIEISAGTEHTCALSADGSVYCWGMVALVGSPATQSVPAPQAVAGGRRFISLSAGATYTCALDVAGQAWCWGQNFGGELGDGTLSDRVAPAPVDSAARFVALAAGGSPCALDASGQAWCWGANVDGAAGQAP